VDRGVDPSMCRAAPTELRLAAPSHQRLNRQWARIETALGDDRRDTSRRPHVVRPLGFAAGAEATDVPLCPGPHALLP
jgi:hypothetical protein